MGINWREKAIMLSLESSYGVDATPGAGNGILAKEVNLSPMEGNDTPRNLDLPHMGDSGSLPTGVHRRLRFQVELAGSGAAGTPPAWGPAFRACGMAETIVANTSVTYNPVTNGHESSTLYMHNGGTLYKLLGARGNCTLMFPTEDIPTLQFDFTGLWNQVADAAMVTPTNLATYTDPVEYSTLHSDPLSLNGTDLATRSLQFNLGNTVETRFLTGADSVVISGKSEMAEATVEAVPVATLNPEALAMAKSNIDMQIAHGKTAGNIITLRSQFAQMQRPGDLSSQQNVTEWGLRLKPRPSAGNDQFTLTLT